MVIHLKRPHRHNQATAIIRVHPLQDRTAEDTVRYEIHSRTPVEEVGTDLECCSLHQHKAMATDNLRQEDHSTGVAQVNSSSVISCSAS